MIGLLNQYLLDNHEVLLPGLGLIRTEQLPAQYDIAGRIFESPSLQMKWQSPDEEPSFALQKLLGFVAQQMDISEEEAYSRYQLLKEELQKKLETEGRIDWIPLGVFEKDESGLYFSGPLSFNDGFDVLEADRVIRQGATHAMKVGDTETTNTAMEALLAEESHEEDHWWILPLVIALVAIVIIVWKRFSAQ